MAGRSRLFETVCDATRRAHAFVLRLPSSTAHRSLPSRARTESTWEYEKEQQVAARVGSVYTRRLAISHEAYLPKAHTSARLLASDLPRLLCVPVPVPVPGSDPLRNITR